MKLKYLVLVLVLIFNMDAFGQISALADFSEATEYSDSDFVFVFCSDNINSGELIARDSTGFGGYDFEWFKFNDATNHFSDILPEEDFTINNDSTSSIITNLATGGYKVVMNKPDTVQEYVAWVYNNTNLSIELNFDEFNDCDNLVLRTEPYYHTITDFNTPLNYYDTLTETSRTFQNKINLYEWTSVPEMDNFRSYNGPFTSIGEDPLDNDSELPTENTTFSVLVTDRFGCQVKDDKEYTAIETDADFSWTLIDDKTEATISSGDSESDLSGQAPLRVRFTNESLNGENYTWFFGDSLWNNDIDTIKTSDFLLEPEHTYYYTDADTGKTYILRLFSENNNGCRDSIFFNIKVNPSKIEFPNVFTPNNDNLNDVFIVKEGYQSIRSFKITIFNRVGQVVHEFEGDLRDWEGWKGKVKGSNREAPEGNYFFVVEVTGWDNVNYNNKNLGTTSNSETSEGGGDQVPVSKNKNFGIVRLFRTY